MAANQVTQVSVIVVVWRRWLVGGLVLLLVVSGCGKDPKQASIDAYADEFAAARAEWPAPRVHAVLADGQITDQEYEELRAWLEQCIIDAGYPGTTIDDKGMTVPVPPSAGADWEAKEAADVDRCEAEVGWPSVQVLYKQMRTNPLNVDRDVLMAECLVRHGVVAAPFTAKEYEAAMESLHQKLKSGEADGLDINLVLPVIMKDKEQANETHSACNEEPLK